MSPLVLVVDDYPDGRELIALALEAAGFRVIAAASGEEAVDLARVARPDAAVMDLYMPGMDGIEATRYIKAQPELRHLPVIAYTARPELARDTGDIFAAVCPKPCPPETLVELLRSAIAARRPTPS